jgi:hypothetical protein
MNVRLIVALLSGVTACGAFSSDSTDATGAGTGPMDAGAGSTDAGTDGAPAVHGPAIDLASGQQTPADIVTDTANVYWLNRSSGGQPGSIMKLAKSGGAPVPLTEMIPSPYSMTADATHLYFTANDDGVGFSFLLLFRQDKVGGPAEKKQLNANGTVNGCTIQGGDVFVTLEFGGTNPIVSVDGNAPAWGGAPVVTIPGTTAAATTLLAVDATYVYATSADAILRVAKADGQSTVFATTTGIAKAIVFDPDTSSIYWADASAVRRLETGSPGGAPTDIATDQPGPSAIAFDATTIYWTNVGTTPSNGSVRSVPKGGGVAQTISASEVEPLGIAVDDSGLYWTNHGDGRVRVARK